MSVIHPGSSINFDAANLQQNDDDEMLQEELRQQKELRELLSAELSDDLLDDDHSSVNDSQRSLPHDGISEQDAEVDSPVIPNTTSGTHPWTQGVQMAQPMTSSPGDALHNGYYGRQMNGYHYNTRDHYNENYSGGHQQQYYDPSYGVVTSQPQQQWQQQGYGNGHMFHQARDTGVGQYMQYSQVNSHQHPHEDSRDYPYPTDRREVVGQEAYNDVVDGHHIQQQQQEYIQYNKPGRNTVPMTMNSMEPSPGPKTSYRQSYPPHMKNFERQKHDERHRNVYGNNQDSMSENDSRDEDKLQREFDKVSNDTKRDESSRQMVQLQILYKARGKKLDELKGELEELKSEGAREKRILNHQLAMAKDQKDGMGTSLEESQHLVAEKDREITELKGTMDAQSAEIESLKSSKNELLNKIQVSERTIESLHEQLTQLSHSEAIERAREQHNAVLNATTQRHEMQVLELTTQLDECRQEINEKNDEMEKIRFHLNKVSKESEQMLLDKTEVINRLTKNLDEAQNQCQGLLAGSSENAIAKHHVTDLMSERKQNEEEIAYLKMQMEDAENHLKLYENALQLGAGGSAKTSRHVRGGSMSDSLSELMGAGQNIARKLDWKTPQSTPQTEGFEAGSQEELIDGLRNELQRALKCNKMKRDEVTKLKAQCSEMEQESTHWRSRADEAQSQLKLNATVMMEKTAKSNRDGDAATIEDLEEKLKIAEDEIERLEHTCTEVKQRMAEMIQEHDMDKQDAVERCERALLQLHEDAKQTLRDEIVSDHEQKLFELSVEHDAKLREMSAQVEHLQHELHDVKQSYVHVCAEKDNVQSSVQQQLLEDFEKEKESMLTEHQEAIEKLENDLHDLETGMKEKIKEARENSSMEWDKEREKLMSELKGEWEKEKEMQFTQRMDTQIALAKVNWFEEFSSSKQKAIQVACANEEQKWTKKINDLKQQWEEEKEQEIGQKIAERVVEWETQKEAEIQKMQDDFQSDKEAAVKMATCMAELNKNLQKQGENELLDQKVKELEESWRTDKEEALKKARKSWILEQEKNIQDAVDGVKRKMEEDIENERLTQKALMEKAVLEIKKICDQEKQQIIKQKNSDMDSEIKKLQDQHRKDYEKFVDEHKQTLASFLEREKTRTKPKAVMRDCYIQTEVEDNRHKKVWLTEKQELESKHVTEIKQMREDFAERSQVLHKEIQDLKTEKSNLTSELNAMEHKAKTEEERYVHHHQQELAELKVENEKLQTEVKDAEIKLEKLAEKQKFDIVKLKERMREEYRRWKKERSVLIEKLKDVPPLSSQIDSKFQTPIPSSQNSTCEFCRESQANRDELLKRKDEAMKKAITELSEIYAGTLKMIKDEMMAFISESRGRTRETVSRERKRAASILRSHYQKAVEKLKPEKEIETPSEPRVRVFESDTDSQPDTRILQEIGTRRSEPVITPKPTNIKTPNLLHQYSDTRPKPSLVERYLNESDFTQYPTKLTPENPRSLTGRDISSTQNLNPYNILPHSSRRPQHSDDWLLLRRPQNLPTGLNFSSRGVPGQSDFEKR